MLIVATIGALFLLEPVEPDTLTAEELYSMSAAELKEELAERMRRQMNRQLIYYAVIAVLICVVPMGNTNRLTRGAILAAIGLVGRFVAGDQAGSLSSLVMMSVFGGALIAVLCCVKAYNKAMDNGKRPMRERWDPSTRHPAQPDDPESLARLEKLRAIAAGPPPAPS